MLFVMGLPSVLMGASFPVANACIQQAEAAVGRRAGALYLANTAGGVAGSLATGFLLLPAFGRQGTVTVLALGAALGLVPMALLATGARRGLTLLLALAPIVVAAGLWARLDHDFFTERWLILVQKGEAQLLAARESPTELVAVVQVGPLRTLYTNGHSMSSTEQYAQRYMRLFSHLPLLMSEAPTAVLVICFGVGNTLHAASLHPTVNRLEIVDLSRNVLEHAPWFAETSNHHVLEDPRVSVFVNDGRQHLRMTPAQTFDLITPEPPPIALAGVSALYSREFYELARSRLKPGG